MGTDNRPKTVEYVTEAIFQPTCGAAQCHSTFAGNDHDVFDTVIGVRSSLVNNGLVELDVSRNDRDDPSSANLIIWITQIDPFGLGIGRMPYDAPMPAADVELLENWIQAGARGAQCNPAFNAGLACDSNTVVHCDESWNFSTPVVDCTTSNQACLNGACK
jgi:hypothetical protein